MSEAHDHNINVDLLLRDELIYELNFRGIQVPSTILAKDCRMELRKIIKSGEKKSNVAFLKDSLVVENEIKLLEEKCQGLEKLISEMTDVRPIDYARVENRVIHLSIRMKNIKILYQDEEEIVNKSKEMHSKLKSIYQAFKEKFSVDAKEKALACQRLSQSNVEEEENDVFFDNLSTNINRDLSLSNENFGKNESPDENRKLKGEGNMFDQNMYSKLPNPLEKYVQNFKHTDGLNVQYLIYFLKNMIKIKKEIQLSDKQLLNLSMSYCSGPLLNIILDSVRQNITFDTFHEETLRKLIPINLRESLKRELVHRPQKLGENLSMYIEDIKNNCEVLRCLYSERDQVEYIKMGINPECRNRLVFTGNPISFNDLEGMCIQSQNFAYNDGTRTSQSSDNRRGGRCNNVQTYQRRCYICNRVGHLQRSCYRNPMNQRNVSSGDSTKNKRGGESGN